MKENPDLRDEKISTKNVQKILFVFTRKLLIIGVRFWIMEEETKAEKDAFFLLKTFCF